jgi:hypothetical protein
VGRLVELGWAALVFAREAGSVQRARRVTLVSTVSDRLYVFGPAGDSLGNYYNDVWESADGGYTFRQITAADDFAQRGGSGVVALVVS